MAKKKAQDSQEGAVVKAFSICRQLPASDDKKPDGLIFCSSEPMSKDEIENLLKNPDVRALLPKDASGNNLPILGLSYLKEDALRHPEHRLVISANSYYNMSLADKFAGLTVYFEDHAHKTSTLPKNHTAGELRSFKIGDVLDSCKELYRMQGCDGCPKKGKECVDYNFGYRPWIFEFAYNRRDDAAVGLTMGANVDDRDAHIDGMSLVGKSFEDIVKGLKGKEIAGFEFRAPTDTQPDTTNKSKRPLRSPLDHLFLPLEQPKAKDKKAAD